MRIRTLLRWAALCVVLTGLTPVQATDHQRPRFQHLDQDDGLSQSMVYAITQDREGFMWFGTQDGLNRFDGYEFVVHTPRRDDPGSLANESIRTLLVAGDGTLWVATDAGGLSRYDSASESFIAYRHDSGVPASIGNDRVRALFEDSQGRFWVGTDGAGLARLDRATGQFEHFRHDAADAGSISDDHVWSIAEGADGALWIATTVGLNRLDADTGRFQRYRHEATDPTSLSHDEVRVLYVDRQGELWAGTAEGLNRYDRRSGGFERFLNVGDDPSSLSSNRITAIFQDNSGMLWIGTVDGLNAWDPAARGFDRYRENPADPFSLPHDTIMSIFQDRAGVLWVGSYDGISRWSPATRAMLHFRQEPGKTTSLSNDTVTTFTEDPAGHILVGTFGGGINVLDRASGQFSPIVNDPADDSSISGNRVMALLQDSEGNLWAGTRASGLNRRAPGSESFERFAHDPGDPDSLSANGITYVLEDRNGGIWIATFGGGLNYYDGARFRHFRHDPEDPATLSSDRILLLYEDAAGGIWVGTYASGLNHLDPYSSRITRYANDPANPDSLASNGVTMIREGANGDLWIGVKGAGLDRWRSEDREAGNAVFQHLTESDGLPNATIYSGQWDSSGYLWLSTGRGLSRLDTETMTFRNFDMSHGLQGEEFNLSAGYRAENGELFFGGMNGFNAFQPITINGDGPAPTVVVTELLSFNQPFDLTDYRRTGAAVNFRHDQDVVGFEFAALDYAAPEKTRYQYRLDGMDADWVDAGEHRHATYSNLPAGDYVFRVRAINNSGIASTVDAALPFVIAPAPWATWWAWTLYGLAFAALLLLVVRMQARRVRMAARIRHAEEIHQLQGRLTNAQQIANVGNWEWELSSDELWWSDQLFRLLSLPHDAFPETYAGFLDRVHPEDRGDVDREIRSAIKEGRSFTIDHRIIWPDGSERVVAERGEIVTDQRSRPIRLAATMHDITDRKAAEDVVRRQASFQAMLASLSASLLNADARDVDATINEGLESIGAHYELDSIAVRWFTDDRRRLETSHAWSRSNSRPASNGEKTKRIPWVTATLLEGRDINVPDIDDFPEVGAEDEGRFRSLGIQSLLMVPLSVDTEMEGTCQFATRGGKRDWPADVVAELKLLSNVIANAVARRRAMAEVTALKDQLQAENLYLREEVKLATGFDGIVGEDPGLKRCLQAVEKVAPTDVAVLVLGETGTGKELIARAIHKLSRRADGPMISVNCPALPGNLIESELFGHEKGSFTGADSQRKGRFEIAKGGTIFLDEIGELPMDLQAKLLRVLQTGEFERIGGTETLHADVRLVAATNRNLPARIKQGEFRSDLYFRINSFPISLPPLRERSGDIPALAEHFVHKHSERLNRDVVAISARFLKRLREHSWPGNIRELESTIERALISSTDHDLLDLDEPFNEAPPSDGNGFVELQVPDGADLAEIERTYILAILDKTSGRIAGSKGAAERLGMPSSTLRSKMKKLGIDGASEQR